MERILAPQLFDAIRERFGQITDALTYTSFFYGGAVRDALAGMPLQGDLDIVVANVLGDINAQRNNIHKYAPNWKKQSEKPVPAEYADAPSTLIAHVEEYTSDERIAQLMVSAGRGGDVIERALYVVKQVDIVCCGVALDCWGYVYEMVPNAIVHCRERILVYNEQQQYHRQGQQDARYVNRIRKLKDRGWRHAYTRGEF